MIWTPERAALARASCQMWEGTPHVDRIAKVGVGVDCIKLVHEILVGAGVIEWREFTGYDVRAGMHSYSDRLRRILCHVLHCDCLPGNTEPLLFGDVLVFTTGRRSGHVGFYEHIGAPEVAGYIWHALAGHWVTKSDIKLWRSEIDSVIRLTQVGWKNDPSTAVNL